MACNITSGFTLGCRDNTGGVRKVYILGGSDGAITDVNRTDGAISEITGSGTFYTFEQVKQTSNFTETINSSVENGTIFYQQDLVLQFHKISGSFQEMVEDLGKNPEIYVILETNNGSEDNAGRYFLLGQYNGLTLSAGTGQTGTAFGDLNGYNLTFSGQEPIPAGEIVVASGDIDDTANVSAIFDTITFG